MIRHCIPSTADEERSSEISMEPPPAMNKAKESRGCVKHRTSSDEDPHSVAPGAPAFPLVSMKLHSAPGPSTWRRRTPSSPPHGSPRGTHPHPLFLFLPFPSERFIWTRHADSEVRLDVAVVISNSQLFQSSISFKTKKIVFGY